MTSCSGPLSSRGGGSPRSAASARSTPKPKACQVRASDSVDVPPSRPVTCWRSVGRSAAARGQHEARVGAQALPLHGIDDELDGEGRLAAARPAQDAQHPGVGVERGPLPLVEPHLRRDHGGSSAKDDHRRIPSRPVRHRRAGRRVCRGAPDGIPSAVPLRPRHDDGGPGTPCGVPGPVLRGCRQRCRASRSRHFTSKRSASMTCAQAATKSWTNFSLASSLA